MAFLRLAACSFLALQTAAPAPKPPVAEAPALFSRIAIIGASASAGFNAHVTLADALDAQIAARHDAPKNFSSEALFVDPSGLGEEQVARAAALEPTLVVAADFLFWFGYGEVGDESERLENLELGLELLEKLKCPLIISHFPDMTPAVGKMLLASQMPKKETLVKLDTRVGAWAKTRGRVAFVAMPQMLDKLRGGTTLTVGGVEFAHPTAKPRLLQRDELHPTAMGLGVLARLCIDASCESAIGAKPAEFHLELGPKLEALHKLAESRAPPVTGGPGAPEPKKSKQLR